MALCACVCVIVCLCLSVRTCSSSIKGSTRFKGGVKDDSNEVHYDRCVSFNLCLYATVCCVFCYLCCGFIVSKEGPSLIAHTHRHTNNYIYAHICTNSRTPHTHTHSIGDPFRFRKVRPTEMVCIFVVYQSACLRECLCVRKQ